MRVLIHLHSLSSGGAERVVSLLANHWCARGWEVAIVTVADASRDFYELHPHVQRIGLDLSATSGSWRAALWNNGKRLARLRTALRKFHPDLALGLMASANCILFLAAVGTSIPVVACERTYPPAERLGGAWEWLRRHVYPYIDAVVVQTQQSADWLRNYCTTRRIAVIPNMVVVPLVSRGPHVPILSGHAGVDDRKILLAVGRLSPEKRFDQLIAAFAQLVPDHSQWQLCIVGDGRSREELEGQVARLGLNGRVSLLGTVGNVGDWYAAADLFVLTSRFEGFPNALLEAMAHGVPAVSIDCRTGPREILRHEVDGLLVAQEDLSALVYALGRVMADDRLRASFASRAGEVQERFSMSKITEQWERLFAEVVRGKP